LSHHAVVTAQSLLCPQQPSIALFLPYERGKPGTKSDMTSGIVSPLFPPSSLSLTCTVNHNHGTYLAEKSSVCKNYLAEKNVLQPCPFPRPVHSEGRHHLCQNQLEAECIFSVAIPA